MGQLVEARRDVRLEHPVVVPGAEGVDLGDRVLGPAPRAEAVTNRLEIRLEHRFQHQHQGSLDEPVHRRRDTQPPELPR